MDRQRELDICVDQSYPHPRGNYTIYRVVIQRFLGCNKEEKVLYKRFSDFLKLHRRLSRVYEALDCSKPFPVLSKNRFRSSVIEARRRALDDFVKFIASNEHLYCHTSFTRFANGSFLNHVSPHGGTDDDRLPIFPVRPPLLNAQTTVVPQIQARLPSPSKADSNELHPPKRREILYHLESPLSSSTDNELDGDSLPLVWEFIDQPTSQVTTDIQAAKRFSREGHWKDAFECYRTAACNLLKELKSNPDRKEEYRCLLSACLAKAEFIHREHLFHSSLCENKEEEDQSCPVLVEPQELASLCRDATLSVLFGSVEELSELRVCRIEGDDLIVYNRSDSSVKYTLKSRSLPPKAQCSALTMSSVTSTGLITSPQAERILPVGRIAFMSRLHRLIEAVDHSRLFLLVERTKGELRLVDWLAAYIHRRILALLATRSGGARLWGRGDAAVSLKHLAWWRKRSTRHRELVDQCLKKREDEEEEQNIVEGCAVPRDSTDAITFHNCSSYPDWTLIAPLNEISCTTSPSAHSSQPSTKAPTLTDCTGPLSPILTAGVIFSRYPPCPLPPSSRSHSMERRHPFVRGNWPSPEEETYNRCLDCHEIPLLPERRSILWAAELVSVVSWLHAHQIVLSNLDRSRVYLTPSGHIEIDYFFRWDTTNGDLVSQLNEDHCGTYSCAPELLVGRLAHTFLCGNSWERRVVCDWWSLGVILYEVFTGLQLHEAHPRGVLADAPLNLPPTLSSEVVDFLTLLLKLNPSERLSDSTVKHHPIFESIDWSLIDSNALH